MILLDTNVISELVRPVPAERVVAYIAGQAATELFTAAICAAELHFGLALMPEGRRRADLLERVTRFLDEGFADRILPFELGCAVHYGVIRHARQAAGRPFGVEDAMIAATARAFGAVLATRNIKDFQHCGITVIDPWVGG